MSLYTLCFESLSTGLLLCYMCTDKKQQFQYYSDKVKRSISIIFYTKIHSQCIYHAMPLRCKNGKINSTRPILNFGGRGQVEMQDDNA